MSIRKIFAEGFKSLGERTELDLNQLTILAGQNSSGKSSIMQSLLLLKQTFDAAYDPGPLLINGPNVVFSQADQMFSSALGRPRLSSFSLGVGTLAGEEIATVETAFKQERDAPTPLRIEKCIWTSNGHRVELRAKMTSEELERIVAIPDDVLRQFTDLLGRALRDRKGATKEPGPFDLSFTVERNRAFLTVTPTISGTAIPFLGSPVRPGLIENHIRGVLHVPALRGNPRRTYPVSAVEQEFPGQFQDYVASIIAHWQRTQKATLNQLGADLRDLGLTWKVRAQQITDTEVEIRVGRLSTSQRGGSRDLVGIADVGFGLSQSLPVLVALLVASPGQLVYLEQPEIHLHPRAQLALVEPIRRAIQRRVQVVLETHSDLLLLGIQRAIAAGELPPDEVGLRWFNRDDCGMTHITSATFDQHGALGDVGIDFSEVSLKAIRDYLEAAAER
jgi:hypothetical protein